MTIRIATVCLAIAGAFTAQAEIRYKVHPLPETKQLAVEITIPTKSPVTLVQIPRWMPGYYVLSDSGKSIKELAVSGPNNSTPLLSTVNDYTWKITAGRSNVVTVSYKVPFNFSNGMGHYSGTPTYMYVAGRTQEPCHLSFDVPKEWKIAVGLEGSGSEFKAPTYDVLADNSVSLGNFVESTYTTAGKKHTLALIGLGADKVDLPTLVKQCEFVSKMETDFMGGAPYDHYVWHMDVHTGRGFTSGIEHLSSVEINVGTNINSGTANLFAHEFFHLWNVKRIRSRALGPFDYTKLPKTGALWWLEGVTEYYAVNLLGRYGWYGEKEWLAEIAGNIQRQGTNPQRLKVSPYDSSYRVDETNNGRGNSDGFGLSYYDDGFVAGMCLDLELIAKTNGKYCLDDVELALFKMCKNNQPGFEEDEIRKQLIKFGGESMGSFYDRVVMRPGDMPFAEVLDHVGFQLGEHTDVRGGSPAPRKVTDINPVPNATADQLRLRAIWLKTKKL